MWAGAVWNVEFVVYGGLAVVVFGLSFAQAVVIILIGNLFYLLTGLASLQGPQAGTTTFAISRAPFGPNGNRLPSLFNWVTQVGFEIEGIALIVLAAIALTAKAGFLAGTPAKVIFLIVAVAIQAVLPLLGHAAVLRVLRWLSDPVRHPVRGHGDHHDVQGEPARRAARRRLGIAVRVPGPGDRRGRPGLDRERQRLLALPAGRQQPAAHRARRRAGRRHPVGAAGDPRRRGRDRRPGSDVDHRPDRELPRLVRGPVPDLRHRPAVRDQHHRPVLIRRHAAEPDPGAAPRCTAWRIDTVVCGAFAAYAIFSSRFTTLLADFLLFIIVWLGPWCAIYLVDSWLRRNRYDHEALLNERGGRYFRNGGVHWPAIIAQVVGMVAAALWLNAYSPYVSPLSSRVGGSDFSVFMGLFFGGVTYWLLARKSVRAEGEATPTTAVS